MVGICPNYWMFWSQWPWTNVWIKHIVNRTGWITTFFFPLASPGERNCLLLARSPTSVLWVLWVSRHLRFLRWLPARWEKTETCNVTCNYQVLLPMSCSPAPPNSWGKGLGGEIRKGFTLFKYQLVTKVIMCVSIKPFKTGQGEHPFEQTSVAGLEKSPHLNSGHTGKRNSRAEKEFSFGSTLTIFG